MKMPARDMTVNPKHIPVLFRWERFNSKYRVSDLLKKMGHRNIAIYGECDFLYIFVVEEDKSDYLFEDRITLVKKGVADLRNVKVLPSGKFIISAVTFPEYFTKNDEKVTIDAVMDLEIFAKDLSINNLTIFLSCQKILLLVLKKKYLSHRENYQVISRQFLSTLPQC